MNKTHDVLNQVPPLPAHNAFLANQPLVEALERNGAGWAKARCSQLGLLAGGEAVAWGALANENPPRLHTHDRFGHRLDEVEFHPAWHSLMKVSVEHGLHALPWREPRPGAHVARAAMFISMYSAEAGHLCPISMTYSALPALRGTPSVAKEWEARLTAVEYDGRLLPGTQKRSALAGMAMTEKQGGSDVRANTTFAKPLGHRGPGQPYQLTGHKWFCSAPMSDLFLVLAQTEAGLSCFAVPRYLPDGTKNGFFLQRLKDKLGNRSNASSEVEFQATWGQLLGEEGRGVATIIEMVNHTRLDCVLGSAALFRQGVVSALHHATHRSAFGKRLWDQPLMRNVLADLCLESEAATFTALRLARAYDEAQAQEGAVAFRRLATAVMKYWTCKRAPQHAAEALECHGGNGYVEASGMPRLFRESPLNGIWEGSGNVICLDVLRSLGKEPAAWEAFFLEVEEGARKDPRLARHLAEVRRELEDPSSLEARARRVVEKLALALSGAVLIKDGDPLVAEAFLSARLGQEAGLAWGTLPPGIDFQKLMERSRVA